MGEIVAAFAAAHAPQLITRPPDEKPEQLDASIAAMNELGKILDETKPDVILFFGSDHLESFSLTCYPTFAIVAGSRAKAKFGGREFDRPIHREMAEDILNKLVDRGFDMAYSEDAELGHTFATPFMHIIQDRQIPIIPFFTNVYPAAHAQAMSGARRRDCRHRQEQARAGRDYRQRRHVALPGHVEVPHARIRLRLLDDWRTRSGTDGIPDQHVECATG
jgi:aromatic ring-opening dioxygenase catalytic subunit (LigB family)